MNLIKDYTTVLKCIDIIKQYKKEFITNFFPNEYSTSLWIDEKILKYIEIEETIFIIKDNKDFNSLFYISSSEVNLKNNLKVLILNYPNTTFIVDIILKDKNPTIKNIFKELNFDEYNSLVRMSRLKEYKYDQLDENVIKANNTHLKEIKLLLDQNFDSLAEQIPTERELSALIDKENILIYNVNSQIAGFIIYGFNPFSLHLKYWFVDSHFRNQKIGSKLFKQFLFEGKNTKKQFCWVIESNDNAIEKYLHYGFNKEDIFDQIMIKR
jgi:ribosomal protein S18 acetylase RimI-like enzyme